MQFAPKRAVPPPVVHTAPDTVVHFTVVFVTQTFCAFLVNPVTKVFLTELAFVTKALAIDKINPEARRILLELFINKTLMVNITPTLFQVFGISPVYCNKSFIFFFVDNIRGGFSLV